MELADYVLSRPQGEEAKMLAEAVEKAADAVICILDEGIISAQSKYNGK
jgi:PTH1 family peptidyl-tRNA hydrolase